MRVVMKANRQLRSYWEQFEHCSATMNRFILSTAQTRISTCSHFLEPNIDMRSLVSNPPLIVCSSEHQPTKQVTIHALIIQWVKPKLLKGETIIFQKHKAEREGQHTPRGPSAPPGHPVRPKPMNRVDQLTRVLSDTASVVTQGSPALELLRERGYTAPRDPSLTQAMFGPVSRDTSLCESMFGVHKLTVCDLHRCVLVSSHLICRS